MSIRSDYNTLLEYARLNNITVEILPKRASPGSAAEIDFDINKISLYINKNESLRNRCMSLLHELCHLIGYRYNPREYEEYFRVQELDNPTSVERYEIYKIESRDTRRMDILAIFLNLQSIPIDLVKRWSKYDIWQYWFYYENNRYPSLKERQKMQKRLDIW